LLTWEPGEEPDPDRLVERFDSLEREMKLFDAELAGKPRVVAVSKIDLPEVLPLVEGVSQRLKPAGFPVLPISSVTGEGLDRLVGELYALISSG
jgi:GTP-binding protein